MMIMVMSVGAGGALGAVIRYLVGVILADRYNASSWVGTLCVNISGCILMGCLAALIANAAPLPAHFRGFLIVGFLGALTTFSSYALDVYGFFVRNELLSAFFYLSASVILSLGGFMLAYGFMRLMLGSNLWS